MAILILIVAIGLGVWLTFSGAPRWLPWLLPFLVAAPWVVGYLRERDEVDTQPGLLVLGGFLSVLAVCAALLATAEVERRRDRA